MNLNLKFTIALILFLLAYGSLIDKRHKTFDDYSFYVVKTSSMGHVLRKGAVVVVKRKSGGPLIGEIVTFKSPLNINELITHRIIGFSDEVKRGLITKGDANNTIDPWILASGSLIGKVVLTIPLIGYLVWVIQSPLGLIILVVLPGMYLFFGELNDLLENSWKNFFNNRRLIYRLKRYFINFQKTALAVGIKKRIR